MKILSRLNNLNLFSIRTNKTIKIIRIDLKFLEEKLKAKNNDVSEKKRNLFKIL